MSATFKIAFLAEYYSTFIDELIFGVVNSNQFIVKLHSYREIPFLKGLVYTNEDLVKCDFYSQTFTDDIYNFTFDCGSILNGQTMQLSMILQNCKTVARYFIMSEDDWIYKDITVRVLIFYCFWVLKFYCFKSVSHNYKLILPEFTISPAYLKLEKDEVTELEINFHPNGEGLRMDKLYLVCDNNSVQEIDIIGDSMLYKTCYFKIKVC